MLGDEFEIVLPHSLLGASLRFLIADQVVDRLARHRLPALRHEQPRQFVITRGD
jgi:hypothetical protein